MKNTYFGAFLVLHILTVNATQEEAVQTLIALFRKVVTSQLSAEVTNAQQDIDKGRVRDAIKHLVIAGQELETKIKNVFLGNVRVDLSQGADNNKILKDMIADLKNNLAVGGDQETSLLLEKAAAELEKQVA